MKRLLTTLIAACALMACSGVDDLDASPQYGPDETRANPISPRVFYAQLDEFVGRYQMQATPSDPASERLHKIIFATALGHYLAVPDAQNRDLYNGIYQSWRIAANSNSTRASFDEEQFEHFMELIDQARASRSIEPLAATRASLGWGEQANTLAGVLPLLFGLAEDELGTAMLSVNDRVKMMYVCDLLPLLLNSAGMDFTDYLLAARIDDPLVDEALASASGAFFTFEDGYNWLWTNYPEDMYLFDMLVSALPVIAAQQSPDFIAAFGRFCQNPDYHDFVPEEQLPKLLVCLALSNEAAKYWNGNVMHSLTVDPAVIDDVPWEGGSFNVLVSSTSPWTVEYPSGITSVSPSEGQAGLTNVVVTVGRNTAKGPADQTPLLLPVTFRSGTEPVVLDVYQHYRFYPDPELTVTTTLPAEIPVGGGTYTLHVTSDTPWTSSVSHPNNVSLSPSSGPKGTTMVTVTIPRCNITENSTVTYRVTFNHTGLPVQYEITQLTGVTPTLFITPEVIDNVPIAGGTYAITLSSSSAWNVPFVQSGIEVRPSSGPGGEVTEIEVVVPRNTNISSIPKRTFSIPFTNGTINRTLTIHQDNIVVPPGISVNPTSITAPVGGGTYTVNVISDSGWGMSYTHETSYITATPSSGSAGTTPVTITLQRNWLYSILVFHPDEYFKISFTNKSQNVASVNLIGQTSPVWP